jgi:hypothetical protein
LETKKPNINQSHPNNNKIKPNKNFKKSTFINPLTLNHQKQKNVMERVEQNKLKQKNQNFDWVALIFIGVIILLSMLVTSL